MNYKDFPKNGTANLGNDLFQTSAKAKKSNIFAKKRCSAI
jgi:hypothetical protein